MSHEGSAETRAIRVLIVEDHRLVAELLQAWLEDETGVEVVGVASNVRAGEQVARTKTPDVIVMDYHLPDGTGADLALRVRQFLPRAAVVIVTSDPTDEALRYALAAGAVGYISKGASRDAVLQAVRRAAAGEMLVTPEQLRAVAAPPLTPRAPPHRLTGRELEVLRLMCEGRDTKGIAAALDLEYNTVRGHAQRVLEKLDARSRLEAVVRAKQIGLDRMV